MTLQAKKNIDLLAPMLLAALAGLYYFSKTKNKSWQMLLAILLITFAVMYGVVTKITKAIYERPPITQLPNDVGLTQCSAFNPTALVDALKADLYVPIFSVSSRDESLYQQLLALSNCELAKVYNEWSRKYYTQHSETLPAAIAAEVGWPGTGFANSQKALANRFDSLKLS